MKKTILGLFSMLGFFTGCQTIQKVASKLPETAHPFYFFYSQQDLASLQKGEQVACIGSDSVIAVHYTAAYQQEIIQKDKSEADYKTTLQSQKNTSINPAKIIYVGLGTKAVKINEQWFCPIDARIINESEQ